MTIDYCFLQKPKKYNANENIHLKTIIHVDEND